MRLTRYSIVLLLLSFALALPAVSESQLAARSKPLSPLSVKIRPVQQGLSPADIKPGDVVQLEVAALSYIGITKATLKVTLTGGAKLVGGDDRWSGAMEKGVATVLTITVAAPKTGKGEVKAVLSAGSLHGVAQFSLGLEAKSKATNSTGTKTKDSKGHNIIEFR